MATYKKSRDGGCCSVNFLKYVLFIFNFVFLLSGCAVLGVGVWTLVAKHQYISLLATSTYAVITYLLVAAGSIAIIVSFIGFFGVGREDKCALLVYTFMLLLIFLMEVVSGVMAYVYEEQIVTDFGAKLNETFIENYNMDMDKTAAIDQMQREYNCCGGLFYQDWRHSKGLNKTTVSILAPDSCCITESKNCGKSDHPSNIYIFGCSQRFIKSIREHLIILGAVGLGISCVQVFGMIFACCLYVKLRDYDDY